MSTVEASPLWKRLNTASVRWAHLLAALLLVAMAGAMVVGILADSPVVDEPNHATRGAAYLSTGDPRMSHPHPPLANLLQGLPGWIKGGAPDFTKADGWDRANPSKVATFYLASDYERARTSIMLGRGVTLGMTLLLGLYLYAYCQRFGRRVALFVLLLFATQPMLAAHGHFVTTDMPVTAAAFVTLAETCKLVTTRSPWRLATVGLCLGIALAVKFSGIVFAIVVVASLFYAAAVSAGRYRGASRGGRLLRALRDSVVIGVLAVLVVDASYRFDRTGWTVDRILAEPEPSHWVEKRASSQHFLEEASPIRHLPGWVPLPLPYSYVFGMSAIGEQAEEGGHGGYFFGYHGTTPAYFPVMLVLKATAGAAIAYALALSRRWRRRWPRPTTFVFGFGVVFFLALAMSSSLNVGIRHVLPVVPLLLVLSRGALARILRFRNRLRARVLLVAIVVGSLAEAAIAAPQQLGHFNALIGGPVVGHRLAIVGEDWGQDARALGEWVKAHPGKRFYYTPYGQASEYELRRMGVVPIRWACEDGIVGPALVARHVAREMRTKSCPALAPHPKTTIQHHIIVWDLPAPGARAAPP